MIAAVTASLVAVTSVVRTPLSAVVVNGVRFDAVEFSGANALWRNLAITVKSDKLDQWLAFSAQQKTQYAQTMIDEYRAGLHYGGAIKLSFIDERGVTLDEYLSIPPLPKK